MAKYRKKPVEIEAFRLSHDPWPDWFHDRVTANDIITHAVDPAAWRADPFERQDIWAEIKTLEGVMRADCGDFIIQGVKGEIYPCKPDIFAATYDGVDLARPKFREADFA